MGRDNFERKKGNRRIPWTKALKKHTIYNEVLWQLDVQDDKPFVTTGSYMNIIKTVDQIYYFNTALFMPTQYLSHLIIVLRKNDTRI